MAVRSTMASLISRVRLLINDPSSVSQQFSDQVIQDVLDESRMNVFNAALKAQPTFSGSSITYLNYEMELGQWEDDLVLKQYLTVDVTSSLATSDNINGLWTFSTSTFPPVFLTGKTYDIYRAAAELLERWSASWVMSYSFSSDGQSFQRQQVSGMLLNLAQKYRMKQRATSFAFMRSDANNNGGAQTASLGPTPIDYMSQGDGR